MNNLNKNFFLIIPIMSLFGGLWQNQFIYDGYHWGFIYTNALELLNGKVPYKEIFLEYGILSVLINSLLLIITDKNIYSLIVATCIVYAASLYIISLITLKLTSNKSYSLLSVLIIFLLYPWPTTPWPNFYSFFFSVLFCHFFLKDGKKNSYISGIFLSLSYLSLTTVYNYIIIFFLGITISYIIVLKNKFDYEVLKKLKTILISFLSVISIYFIILYFNDLINIWIIYQKLPFIFNSLVDNYTYSDLVLKYLNFISFYSIFNFISESQWSLYSLMIISNFILIAILSKDLYLGKEIKRNTELLIINLFILSLNFYAQILGLEKLATSISLGIVSLTILIISFKSIESRIMINFIIVFISLYSLLFNFNLKSSKISGIRAIHLNELNDFRNKINNKEIRNFRSQKWNNADWEILNKILFIQKKIKSKCKIKYGANLTKNNFYHSLIKYEKIQVIPFFFKVTGDKLRENIEPNLINTLQEEINNNNIMIISNENNDTLLKLETYAKPIIITKIDNKKNFNFDSIKIFFPKKCS